MSDSSSPKVIPADPVEINEWLENDEVVLVDVRETSEYEREHIAGALLLPMSSFDEDLFPTITGKRLVLHCAVGKRSEAVGRMLLKEGHTDITHMTGGIDAWKAAGLATEFQLEPPEEKPQVPAFLCPPPGEILKNEYMDPLSITTETLAEAIGVLEGRVAEVVAGKSSVGVELSMRLARYFSTAADFWVHLQVEHDLERARHSLGEEIRKRIRPRTSPN